MIKRTFLLLMTLGSFTISGYAQTAPGDGADVSGKNVKGAAGESQFGEIFTTDLYTGTTNINIPIYENKIDDLDMGVAFTYNTAGIKVDRVASNIGIGWELEGVPFIERQRVGLDDNIFLLSTDINKQPNAIGDWLKNHTTEEPDIFIAHLPGRTIRFTVIPNLGDFRIIIGTYPKTSITINVLYYNTTTGVYQTLSNFNQTAAYTGNYIGFRITDEKGNVYEFKGHTETGSVKFDWYKIGNSTSYSSTTKWYADFVTTWSGATTKYVYDQNQYALNYDQYLDEKVTEQYPAYFDYQNPTYTNNTFPGLLPDIVDNIVNWNATEPRLLYIKYPNNTTVNFSYRTDTRRDINTGGAIIDKISVHQNSYEGIDNHVDYQMNQSYMNSNYSVFLPLNDQTSPFKLQYRLCLNSIDKTVFFNGSTPAAERYFTFDYDIAHRLPDRLSPSQDYYGYYNGKTPVVPTVGNYTYNGPYSLPACSVPKHNFNWYGSSSAYNQTFGTDKTPDINYLRSGILTKITNNKGGNFQIYYEANVLHDTLDASNYTTTASTEETGSSNTFDGLRTQKIVFNDGVTTDHDRAITYIYENGGIRFYKRFYYWIPTNIGGYYSNTDIVQRRWYSLPVHNIDLYNGCNHGYSQVHEVTTGYANHQLSRTKYTFSNLVPIAIDSNSYTSFPRLDVIRTSYYDNVNPSTLQEFELGNVLKKEEYIGEGANEMLVSRTDNKYDYSASANGLDRLKTQFTIAEGTCCYFDNGGGGFKFGNYKISRQRRLIKTTETNYSGTTQIQRIINYKYDNYDHLSSMVWTNSKGETFQKIFEYNYTYRDPSSPYQFLVGKAKTKIIGNNEQVLDYEVIGPYTPVNGRIKHSVFTLMKSANSVDSSLLTSSGLAYKLYPTIFPANIPARIDKENTLQDARNNVLESRYNDGQKYVSYVWDSRIGEKIAEVNNAKYSDIAFTSFEGFGANTTGTSDDKGRWIFNEADVQMVGGPTTRSYTITGKYIYKLTAAPNNTISAVVAADKDYVLTYWADLPLNVTINGLAATSTLVKTSTAVSLHMYMVKIPYIPFNPPPTFTIAISVNNYIPNVGFIDEVRLYPANASMVSYTYEPLIGKTSTCDKTNDVLYFQYDNQGRSFRTLDIDKSIIQQTTTNIQGSNN